MFDEIGQYMTGRYISSCEAAWRLNGFDIHQHNPTVQQLVVHLENGMRCYFDPNNPRVNIVEAPKTHLTEFFKQKLDKLKEFLLKTNVFGEQVAHIHTIEFQKVIQLLFTISFQ